MSVSGEHTTAPGGNVKSGEAAAVVIEATARAIAKTTEVDTTMVE